MRYEMEENGNLVQFIFNQEREAITEEDSAGLTRLIRSTELIARSSDSARTYYHYASDEMGSATHIVDEAGNVQNRYEYDAWGNLTVQEEAIPNRFKYTGQQLDPVTQQYYLRARFYNPVIARFTQEDTYRGDGLNLYAYCANNPVYYVDPSGNTVKPCLKNAFDKYRLEGKDLNEAYALAKRDYEAAKQQGVTIPKPDKPSNDGFKEYVRREQEFLDQLAAKQAAANQAVWNYNHRGGITPAERAARKGITGVGTTANGGATFARTKYMYPVDAGQQNVVTIVASGSRANDFKLANEIAGLQETPQNATWHHLDDYDVITGTMTLELVYTKYHEKTYPHSGGCAQYKAATGKEYK